MTSAHLEKVDKGSAEPLNASFQTETLCYAMQSIDRRTVGQHHQLFQPNESSFYATKEELDSAPKDSRIGMDYTPPPPSCLYMQLMVLGKKANGGSAERFLAGVLSLTLTWATQRVLEPSIGCVEWISIAV